MVESTNRRTVHYNSLDEFLADAERLASQPTQTVGNWSFAEILWHLTQTINYSFDGFPTQAPWLVRKLVAPFLKNTFLNKKMKSGFKLPKSAGYLIPPSSTDVTQSLSDLKTALNRFDNDQPTAPHPLLGKLTPEEWRSLHCRHAELHMSFAIPDNRD